MDYVDNEEMLRYNLILYDETREAKSMLRFEL